MPTRGEMLQMVKNMAENVVHSLQTLLMILLNQVATQVSSQEVPMEQATMMNQLMNEVQSQKEKIEELADLMKNQALSPSRRDEAFTLLTESDLEVWDQEVRVYQQPQAAKASPVTHGVSTTPMTSPPTRGRSTAAGKGSFLAPQTKGRVVGTATMLERTAPETPPHGSPSSGAEPMGSQLNQSLAWTTTAMEQWGMKRVTWGKKHPGKTYQAVYEQDSQYVSWCLSRINSLDAQIGDFARYCQTRQQMEQQLYQSQGLI